jgi:hypothetical protein
MHGGDFSIFFSAKQTPELLAFPPYSISNEMSSFPLAPFVGMIERINSFFRLLFAIYLIRLHLN